MIFIVALSGFFIGLQNLGMMLSIMVRRFYPGLIAPLCETVGLLVGWLCLRDRPGDSRSPCSRRAWCRCSIIWAGFRLERLPMRRVGAIGRNGMRWLAPDLLGLARRAGGAAGPRRLRRRAASSASSVSASSS